jgi:hypothetical protein
MDLTLFPKNPNVGEIVRVDGNSSRSYRWNGITWTALKKPYVEKKSDDYNPNQGRMGLHKKMSKDILNEKLVINHPASIANLKNSIVRGTESIYMNGQLLSNDDYNIIDKTVYFNFEISEGFSLICNYSTLTHIEIFNEIPLGEINGVNDKFTLFLTPVQNTESIYFNGVRLYEGNDKDYIIINNILQLFFIPSEKSSIKIDYHAII